MRSPKNQHAISLISLLIIFGVWFLVSVFAGKLRHVDFPSPLTTLLQLFENIKGEPVYDYSIFQHTLTSLLRWFMAYIMAIAAGVSLGFLLGIYPLANKLFMSLIYTLQLVPGLAWIPIALLLFGLGNTSTLFMIFMLAFTPIVITTSSGIKDTPKDLIQSAILMGANKKMLFIHVLIPSALLQIINGLRIALANSWRVLIAAEMVVGNGIGLGYIIIQSRWSLNYNAAFVSIFIIVLIGLLAEKYFFSTLENSLRNKYGYATETNKAIK